MDAYNSYTPIKRKNLKNLDWHFIDLTVSQFYLERSLTGRQYVFTSLAELCSQGTIPSKINNENES